MVLGRRPTREKKVGFAAGPSRLLTRRVFCFRRGCGLEERSTAGWITWLGRAAAGERRGTGVSSTEFFFLFGRTGPSADEAVRPVVQLTPQPSCASSSRKIA